MFPAFLGVVWLLQPWLRDLTIAVAEGLVVLAEGWLIYSDLPAPVFPGPPAVAVGGGMLVCGLDWQRVFAGRLLAFVGPHFQPVGR